MNIDMQILTQLQTNVPIFDKNLKLNVNICNYISYIFMLM
jgi:hypothetical protein